MEGGHSSAGNAILNNVGDLRLRKPLRLWALRDVRSPLAPSAIQTVAACTSRRESFLAPGRGRFGAFLPEVLLSSLRTGKKAGGCAEGGLNRK
jgi:hypothetical protein